MSKEHKGGTVRLDQALVARALVRSRSQAADLIKRGLVSVDGRVAEKPGAAVAADANLVVIGATHYVSRGAEKLIAALDAFGFDCRGRTALDVGASTGGFTDVLLTRGAAKVFAVDVGHGQLSPRVAADPRVVNIEGKDARAIDAVLVPDAIDAVVADVSFISVTKALPAALARTRPGAWLAILVKPQFEAGRAAIGKGGIVRDPAIQNACVNQVSEWIAHQGWTIKGRIPSPIPGGDGNQEFLVGAER